MRKIIAFVLVGLLFFGCEQYLDVELPEQEPRLVINSLLETGDTVKVFLTESISALEGVEFGDNFEYVEGAMVNLLDSKGNSWSMDYRTASTLIGEYSFYYLSDFILEENESYRITAQKDGYEPVSGQVLFPEQVPFKEVTFINLGPPEYTNDYELIEFTLHFDDLPGKNFYEIDGNYYGKIVGADNSYFSGELYVDPVNPAYNQDWNYLYGAMIDDVLLPGANSEFKFRSTVPRNVELEVTIALAQVSESYYNYGKTVGLQQYNRGDILSQPVLVYTNIENGMGVLMARNKNSVVIKMQY